MEIDLVKQITNNDYNRLWEWKDEKKLIHYLIIGRDNK